MTPPRILLLALLAFAAVTPPAPAADKTNVLFLICDDLNTDLACYGHPQVQSPNIDALAARGVRFENAYCQYPLCGPSRASFMAGMYPDQTLIRGNGIYIREHIPQIKTMSQMFRDGGYFATRIGKIYHYSVPAHIGTSGHDDPFSWNYTINPRGRDVDDEADIFSLQPGNFGGTLSWHAAEGTDAEQTDGISAAETKGQLERYKKEGRSFFLAVGLYRPHTPYVAPKKYFDLYPLDQIEVPTVPDGYDASLPAPALKTIRSKKDQVDLPDELARQAIQAYHASITFADAQVGLILAALDETGFADNTVIVFTSDHGYHMGQHGHWQKLSLFENATHVPLIIAAPGVAVAGAVATSPVEMVDFYPTLAELCGLTPPNTAVGKSLVPALKDPAVAVREEAFSQLQSGYSIRTVRHRYTFWGEGGADGSELYDREIDPDEMVNLSGKPEVAGLEAELKARLESRIAEGRKVPEGLKQIVTETKRQEKGK